MERWRLGPYFSSIVRVLPTLASVTSEPAMKPSAWRISAMWDLSLEYGMETVSWYAEFALRKRVSMSAMGSVIVISGSCPSSSWFPQTARRRSGFPAGLRRTGKRTGQGHVAQAHAAQSELAVDRTRPSAFLAPGVATDLELRLTSCLVDQCGLRDLSSP